MPDARVVSPAVIDLVEEFVDDERAATAKHDNWSPLDEEGVHLLHRERTANG